MDTWKDPTDPEDQASADTDLTESYLRQFDAVWDDPETVVLDDEV